MLTRTPSPEAQAPSAWTVKPTAVSIALAATGSATERTFAAMLEPLMTIPAVGLVSMPEILQYARAFNVDEQVRKTWKEVAEYLDTEDQYTPG